MLALLVAIALQCGVERHDIKILADHPVIPPTMKSSITLLRKLVPPSVPPTRRLHEEKIVVEVKGWATAYKLETDQDIHIVFANEKNETMIIESVAPSCASTTLAQTLFTRTRNQLRTILPYDSTLRLLKLAKPICIIVSGFLFFDKIHGQVGVAPNGIEIHPIIGVQKC